MNGSPGVESNASVPSTDKRTNVTESDSKHQETSRVESEKIITSSSSHETLNDTVPKRNTGEMLGEHLHPTQNEGFIQQRHIDSHECHFQLVDNEIDCSSSDKNNEVNSDNHASQRINNSIVSCCTEEQNDNIASGNRVSAALEKQNDKDKCSNLDEIIENFVNDSDIIDDALLDISLG